MMSGKKIFLFILIFFTAFEEIHSKTIAEARNEIVKNTLNYLNTPYLWGGMHPQTGMDCSAFVKLVYLDSGIFLPRVSSEQFFQTARISPSEVLPGDLIFFSMKVPGSQKVDHVGIYVGKGFFVHASFTAGVHIDSVYNPYYFSRMISVRKYKGF